MSCLFSSEDMASGSYHEMNHAATESRFSGRGGIRTPSIGALQRLGVGARTVRLWEWRPNDDRIAKATFVRVVIPGTPSGSGALRNQRRGIDRPVSCATSAGAESVRDRSRAPTAVTSRLHICAEEPVGGVAIDRAFRAGFVRSNLLRERVR